MFKVLEYINPGSLTFWAGVGLVGRGVYCLVMGCAEMDMPSAYQSILEGLAVIGLRRAVDFK